MGDFRKGRSDQGEGLWGLVQVGQQFDLVVIAPKNQRLQRTVIRARGVTRTGIRSLMIGSGDSVSSVEVGRTSRLQPGQSTIPWATRLWIRVSSGQRCDQSIRKATKAPAGMGPWCFSQACTSASVTKFGFAQALKHQTLPSLRCAGARETAKATQQASDLLRK